MIEAGDVTPRPWLLETHQESLVRAANIISSAEVLLIGAGAGMSVDSGVPDFRSKNGFWKSYPPARALGLNYVDLSSGTWFEQDPVISWGFVLHRQRLFQQHEPHQGYHILKRWADSKQTSWVYTSNIDRYFERVGFDPTRITEIHGFDHVLQCSVPCCRETWTADLNDLELDEASLELLSPPPRCPHCDALARPNVLMFRDERWIGDATREQENRMTTWLNQQKGKAVAVIELGAGTTVPNVRFQFERYARAYGTPLIRVNLGEPRGPSSTIELGLSALAALRAIDLLLLQHEQIRDPVE